MKLTRKQLQKLIIETSNEQIEIQAEPGHPSPRTHESPVHRQGSFFASRQPPMGKGYGKIAKDFLFYVQLDSGEAIRIPHEMHIPITSPKYAKQFVNFLNQSFKGETVSLINVSNIPGIINNSQYKNTLYY